MLYYFEVIDQAGRVVPSSKKTAHNYYPANSNEQVIPSLKAGKTADSYQLIAVPLELKNKDVPSVFSALYSLSNKYDNTKWRLFDYGPIADDRKNREYPAFSEIETGKGYWLITRDAAIINPGEGSTVLADDDSPAEIHLSVGHNLIGNPYNFRISWTEVLSFNGVSSGVDPLLSVFNTGTVLEQSATLDRYRGAFVHSDNAIVLEIPVTRNTTLGRIGSSQEVDLTSEDWQLPLTLTDGVLTNNLGGIGMNIQATLEGKDKFDGLNVPMLEGIGMFQMEFPHPEVFADFCREVVPTANSYVWDFAIQRGSDKPLELRWDNETIKDSDNELFLFDPSAQVMKDMKTNNSYILPSSTGELQVLFGNHDHINQKMDELLPLFSSPYPNPAEEQVTIPFRIPTTTDKMEVSIKIHDVFGRPVTTLTERIFQKGSHEVVWNPQCEAGLYLIHLQAGDRESKWVKVQVK